MSASELERKIWKLENIINILNKLVLDLKIIATESGARGNGLSIAAREIARFNMYLERDIFSLLKFEDKSIEDVADKMEQLGSNLRLLGINAILESKRVNSIAAFIICDEVRKIGDSLENILDMTSFRKNLAMENPDRSFPQPLDSVVVDIAGSYWVESMNSIIEIVRVNEKMLCTYPEGPGKMKHQLIVNNNQKIPVVNIHSEFGEDVVYNENSRVLVMNLGHIMYGHTSSELYFGLLVDDIEYAGFLQKGIHESNIPEGIPYNLVKYMYKTKDINLYSFNWDNILTEHEVRNHRRISQG